MLYNYWSSWPYYTIGMKLKFDKRLLDTFQETIAVKKQKQKEKENVVTQKVYII